jgi:ATPase subunit of ABC transporter with duplicated ATPase domains
MSTPSPATDGATFLSLQDIGFAHPGAAAPVFDRLSAHLPPGVGLVCGDEGTGKTTLLRLLAGQLRPHTGVMRLAGGPLQVAQVAGMEALAKERDEQVAQDVLSELVPAPEQHLLEDLVRGLDLGAHLSKPLYQLSTGSRRKVFLAADLARQARLTLLDQPFTALDRPSVEFLRRQFATWAGADQRLLLIADYQPPGGVPLSFTLDLDRLP